MCDCVSESFLKICVKGSDVFLCAIELKTFLKESQFVPAKAWQVHPLFLYSWFSFDHIVCRSLDTERLRVATFVLPYRIQQ